MIKQHRIPFFLGKNWSINAWLQWNCATHHIGVYIMLCKILVISRLNFLYKGSLTAITNSRSQESPKYFPQTPIKTSFSYAQIKCMIRCSRSTLLLENSGFFQSIGVEPGRNSWNFSDFCSKQPVEFFWHRQQKLVYEKKGVSVILSWS